MPKRFFKHKLLLDEHLSPRQRLARLNERFDVKHIVHDLHEGGMDDAPLSALAVAQRRIILTSNVKDFRPPLRADSSGVIDIPETWSLERLDTKLTALLTRHGLLPGSGPYPRRRGGETGGVRVRRRSGPAPAPPAPG